MQISYRLCFLYGCEILFSALYVGFGFAYSWFLWVSYVLFLIAFVRSAFLVFSVISILSIFAVQ